MPTPLISLWRGYRDASLILRVTIALVLGVVVGLPIEAVALLTAIEALVGMGCTALNVTGDLIGSAIIGRSEGERIATQEPAGSDAAPRPEGS